MNIYILVYIVYNHTVLFQPTCTVCTSASTSSNIIISHYRKRYSIHMKQLAPVNMAVSVYMKVTCIAHYSACTVYIYTCTCTYVHKTQPEFTSLSVLPHHLQCFFNHCLLLPLISSLTCMYIIYSTDARCNERLRLCDCVCVRMRTFEW